MMMVKRAITTAPDVPEGRRPFFAAMQQLVTESGNRSLADLAQSTGLSRSYVHRALRGPTPPSEDAVKRIVAALGHEDRLDWLLSLLGRSKHEELHQHGRPEPVLSPRELEVLRVWLVKDSKAEAAASLFISPATLNTHITRIRDKYKLAGRPASSKAALLARALQDGYISLDDLAAP